MILGKILTASALPYLPAGSAWAAAPVPTEAGK
jgi:hypothetical protein